MIIHNNKELINLQEGVYYALDKLETLEQTGGVLSEFGIKVVDKVNTVQNIPSVQEYIASQEALGRELDDLYGDAIAVGIEPPYSLYIFTRKFSGATEPEWFNIGQFPVPGPQGIQGVQGEEGPQGIRGSTWTIQPANPLNVSGYNLGDSWLNSESGDVYNFNGNSWIRQGNIRGSQGPQGVAGPQGIQGPQGPIGPQGIQGPAGQSFVIAGILSNENQLPTPTTANRSEAYLVGNDIDGYNMYVIVGTTELLWFDAGKVEGIQGPQGPQGLQGLQGPAGPAGADGSEISNIQTTNIQYTEAQTITTVAVTTNKGDYYTFSIVAQRGPQGLVGPKGDKGDQGVQGPAGATGMQGPKGDPGTVDYDLVYTKTQVDDKLSTVQSSLTNKIEDEVTMINSDIGEVDTKIDDVQLALQGNIDTVDTDLQNTKSTLTEHFREFSSFQAHVDNYIYTKEEVNQIVSEINQFKVEFVTALPNVGDALTIYFVGQSGDSSYDEYMYINGRWEQIGSTNINLNNYYTISQTNDLVSDAKQEVTTTINNTKTQLEAEIDGVSDALSSLQETVVTKTDQPNQIYGTDMGALDTTYALTTVNGGGTVPLRKEHGQISVGTPESDYDAATKAYVDQATFKTQKLSNQDIAVYDLEQGFYEVENIALTFADLPNLVINGEVRDSSTYRYTINRGFLTVCTSGASNGVFTITQDTTNENLEYPLVTGSYWIWRPTESGTCEIVTQTYVERRLNNTYTKQEVDDLVAGAGGGGGSVEFADSSTIVVSDTETGAKQFNLAGSIVNDISSSLKAPQTTAANLRLVGIEANSTDQTFRNLKIGNTNQINLSDNGTDLALSLKFGSPNNQFDGNVQLTQNSSAYGIYGTAKDKVTSKSNATVSLNSSFNMLGQATVHYHGTPVTTISNLRCSYPTGESISFKTGASVVNNEKQTKFYGDDCADGTFTPQPNTMYEVVVWGYQNSIGGAYIYTGVVLNRG